mmetsp:Transcript_103010/g.177746  ORF Transcript_103010/g.177746 Transcript_103010/m.177746 type:complete len:162 (-) Transcript_103010:171-656(-)
MISRAAERLMSRFGPILLSESDRESFASRTAGNENVRNTKSRPCRRMLSEREEIHDGSERRVRGREDAPPGPLPAAVSRGAARGPRNGSASTSLLLSEESDALATRRPKPLHCAARPRAGPLQAALPLDGVGGEHKPACSENSGKDPSACAWPKAPSLKLL